MTGKVQAEEWKIDSKQGSEEPESPPAEAEDLEDEDEEDTTQNQPADPKGKGKAVEIQTPAESPSKDPVSPDSPPPTKKQLEVQILELHSEHPIVSYDGKIYSCAWAENIGSDFLFTEHDPSSQHPVLRSFDDNVDLLGISSARIISTPAILETRLRRRPVSPDGIQKRRQRRPKIAIGYQASQQRKDQASFLEKIMQIKRGRGEDDQVTVLSQKRNTNQQWRKEIKKRRAAEKKKLERKIGKGGREGKEAAEKLREIERLEEFGEQVWNSRGPGVDENGERRKPGRRSKGVVLGEGVVRRRPRGGGGMKAFLERKRMEGLAMDGGGETPSVVEETPEIWEEGYDDMDLEGNEGEVEGEEGAEYYGEYDDEMEDVDVDEEGIREYYEDEGSLDGDEGAPGEMDDTLMD